MRQAPSIRDNPVLSGLPDFRNLGVWLRVLVAANLMAFLGVLAANRDGRLLAEEFIALGAVAEPVILGSLTVLTLAGNWLGRLPYRLGVLLTVLVTSLVAVAVQLFFESLHLLAAGTRAPLWTAIGTLILLGWFDLRGKAQSPALAEARLLALTARIRPHFLFNALNAVLGVIRAEPRRAESALEELADLFRVLMRENTTLVPLSEEIAVARQYVSLERLRLGERLTVHWDMTSCPPDPLVPPLMLQPLLENAVYHGIEPATVPGEIRIRFERAGDRLRLELSNPLAPADSHSRGNQMAMANIRERLMLFFDLEASMTTTVRDGRFLVRIELPYRPVVSR